MDISLIMNTENINCNIQDGIFHICINRPEKRNALTMDMFIAMAEALKQADALPEVACILVTGAGDVFCAGHDLKAFEQWPQQPDDPVPVFLHTIVDIQKPLVIAVQGSAAGIGVTWLLHADWVVSSAQTTFRLPFIDLGIAPEAASTILLAQAIGTPLAKRLLFGAEKFTGADAYNWGLIAELAPDDQIIDQAWQRARSIASKDQIIMQHIKNWLHPGQAYHERIDEEIAVINAAVHRKHQ